MGWMFCVPENYEYSCQLRDENEGRHFEDVEVQCQNGKLGEREIDTPKALQSKEMLSVEANDY